MNRTLTMVCVLVFTLCMGVLAADEPEAAPPLDPVAHATSFFETQFTEDWEKAPVQLLEGSSILEADPEAANKILEQLVQRREVYGEPVGYELVVKEEFGSSVMRMLFVLKFKAKPVLWEFFYYRPTDTWELANISVLPDFRMIRNR